MVSGVQGLSTCAVPYVPWLLTCGAFEGLVRHRSFAAVTLVFTCSSTVCSEVERFEFPFWARWAMSACFRMASQNSTGICAPRAGQLAVPISWYDLFVSGFLDS